jgi:hypothetical protein
MAAIPAPAAERWLAAPVNLLGEVVAEPVPAGAWDQVAVALDQVYGAFEEETTTGAAGVVEVHGVLVAGAGVGQELDYELAIVGESLGVRVF